jgi:hypothetical protein
LSPGIEHADDLIADLLEGLERVGGSELQQVAAAQGV